MTFEEDFREQFPNLTLKVFANPQLKDLAYTNQTMESLLKDIKEHCLDKEKVKEVIGNYFSCFKQKGIEYVPYHCENCRMKAEIFKELQLGSQK